MSRSDEMRKHKAKIILSQENAIERVDKWLFTVKSQTGVGVYRLAWNGHMWVCNCPDFIKNSGQRPCKHIIALKEYYLLNGSKETLEDTLEKIKPITYSQHWTNYNKAQSIELDLFDQFLIQLLDFVEEPPLEVKRGRPSHSLRDLIFCCVMKTYSQLSSRRSQCLFHQALEKQQIQQSIHYNAISRALLKPELTPVLRRLLQISAEPLGGVEEDFAFDSSGFRCSTFGQYCSEKHGCSRNHNWIKVHISNGVNTNIIADAVVTTEYTNDSTQFESLLRNTAKHFAIGEVSADKAYCSRKNYELVGSFGGVAYIPFKVNTSPTKRGSALWRRAFHYFNLHNEEFMQHYHKRSNVETTFSAIKKKFGETFKSKDRTAQINEMYCKLISYNITVLIHEMIDLDPNCEIFTITGVKKEIEIATSDNS